MAPANVLHGAVRLQGLASSPTPETHVRVACACAMAPNAKKKSKVNAAWTEKRAFLTTISPLIDLCSDGWKRICPLLL
jgi:hypothetical protein